MKRSMRLVGVVLAALLMAQVPAWAQGVQTINVVSPNPDAPPDAPDPNPSAIAETVTADVNAKMTNPPTVDSTHDLVGPIWSWSDQDPPPPERAVVRFSETGADGSFTKAPAGYYSLTISQSDPSSSEATLKLAFFELGYYKVSPIVTVVYRDRATNEVRFQGRARPVFVLHADKYVLKSAKLKEVSFPFKKDICFRFQGDDDEAMSYFNPPQWKDTNKTQSPVMYKRGTKMRVAAVFAVDPAVPKGVTMQAKAKGPDDIEIEPTDCNVKGTEVKMPEKDSKKEFKNEVSVYDPLELSWQLKPGDDPWVDAGKSKNLVYLVYNTPKLADPLWTYVDVGCQFGKTKTAANDVRDAIWGAFADASKKKIKKASDPRVILTYYGYKDVNFNGKYDEGTDRDYNGLLKFTPTTTEFLVYEGNGQCGAWVGLFRKILQTQGLESGTVISVKPLDRGGKKYTFLAVKNFKTKGYSPWHLPKNKEYAGMEPEKGLEPTEDDSAADDVGLPGQGNSPNPWALFYAHAILELDGKIYDPSYGVTFANRLAWERGALIGTTYYDKDKKHFIHALDAKVSSCVYDPP